MKNILLSSLAKYLYSHGYLSGYVDVDALTGVFNRSYYEKEVPKMVAQAKRTNTDLVVVVVDLDGLKKENDRNGHDAGDKLINGLARLLVKQVRGSDVVIRIGGDEFLVVLWNSELSGAKKLMEKIFKTGRDKEISFSYGLALVKKGVNIKKRIVEADKNMYAMKRERKKVGNL